MARSKFNASKRLEKIRASRVRKEHRAARRKITKAINERFAAIILRGQLWTATDKEKLQRNIAIIQLRNRQDKNREKHHMIIPDELKRTRKAKAARELANV